jgi:glycosyltransferase involved in cell wall biosynthesis
VTAKPFVAQPKTLHIVLNGVLEDSRVLKCAWSLGNAGWDVLVCGATPHTHSDSLTIGYANIQRLPLRIVVTQIPIARVLRKLRYFKRRFEEEFLPAKRPTIPNLNRALSQIIPVAKKFKPDVIHAHDYTALPIAGAIVAELKKIGMKCALVYDAHEYLPGVAHLQKPLVKMYTDSERKYAALSDAILSVSDGMTDLLIPHLQITDRPDLIDIVANDPLVEGQQTSDRNLRTDCGISADIPLLVYSGAVAPQRGIATAVQALRLMPAVHLALIANPKNQTVQDLQASALDLKDRFHVVPYVPNSELVSYLSSADIGLIPIHHRLNHEISLITKFGEYMQAKLPILVSDVKTMAQEVRRLGNGEVFVAEDVNDFIEGAKKILANPEKYSDVYTDAVLDSRSWERQAQELLNVYQNISGLIAIPREHLPFKISEPQRL